MPEDNKTFFDKWMDKKVENVVDTSADALSRKFKIYLTAFYLTAMLVYVTYSVLCLNEIGTLSNTWAFILGGAFYGVFVAMAVLSIWEVLKDGSGTREKLAGLNKLYLTSKILRRVLGLVTYVITVVTLFKTWDQGLQYRLFSSIMLIAFTAGNLWIVVSDIFEKKLAKQREIERLIEEARQKEEEKKKTAIKEKVRTSAEWVSAQAKQAIKNKKELKENQPPKQKSKPNPTSDSVLGKFKKPFTKPVEITEDPTVVEISSEEIEW